MHKLFIIATLFLGMTLPGVFCHVSAQEVQTVQFFSDLDQDSVVGQAAANLRQAGVINGYDDGTFQPDKPVNRAELAKFLLLGRGRDVDIKHNNGRFPDVKEGEWYVKYIIDAADLGIISGYPSGNFKPAQTVNTAEFLKMLSKTFTLVEDLPQDFADVTPDDWFAPYVGNVPEWNLFPDRDPAFLEPAREMTRGEVAIALYRVMRPKLEELKGNTNQRVWSITRENTHPLLIQTYSGKSEELIFPIILSGEGTIESVQLKLSTLDFLDQIWVKGGEKVDANRLRVIVPTNTILAGGENLIEVYASIKDSGLVREDNVEIVLEKITGEKNGQSYSQECFIDGFELMIF